MDFQMVIARNEGNLITAPLIADIVISLAAFGANENTRRQMCQVLNFQADDRLIQIGYQNLIDKLNV